MASGRTGTVWRPYDFRHPGKLSSTQVETLARVSQSACGVLSNVVGLYLRTETTVSLQSVDQVSAAAWVASAPPDAVSYAFGHPPVGIFGLAQFDVTLVMRALDRALAGAGVAYAERRELTEIERAVFLRLVRRMLDGYAGAWSPSFPLSLTVDATEDSPRLPQTAGADGMVVAVRFHVETEGVDAQMALVWPYAMLVPVIAAVMEQGETGGHERLRSKALERRVYDVPVVVSAVLGGVRLTKEALAQLAPGDVVVLERRCDEPIAVEVDGVRKFAAIPGRHGGRWAVQLEARPEVTQ